ncbi:MAG: tRNA (adenosine(37)-N6)-threonylcarbamoyltransferase complex dimerization subunit type 1 TsaB [Chitinophagaceae bacterium]|nr:tRNA (adenosine(37)-N6)-threonylcarbamoyltransferase complex dimerization subunit type 1 TsaB [Chitinophagaceae bacterium]
MAIFLNIDTTEETASVCLSDNAESIAFIKNADQKDHAAWLHKAIQSMINDSGIGLRDINAVAVSIGPGSYTGLRVGLSAAKGLCYALNIPLIAINSLKLIAYAAKSSNTDLICPMIDARRMEVFTALYNCSLTEINKPEAVIINEMSFSSLLAENKIVFCGSGSKKLQNILSHPNALFSTNKASAIDMPHITSVSYLEKSFAEIAYTEPLYIKEFYSPSRKPLI